MIVFQSFIMTYNIHIILSVINNNKFQVVRIVLNREQEYLEGESVVVYLCLT